MTGMGVAGLAGLIIPGVANDPTMLAVVGMSATLGAVVRAPVTSILIVFEMTHQFALVPPLMVTALISQGVSRALLKHNFYDALLEQDGHQLHRFAPPRDLREWQQQPVTALANPKPVVFSSLAPEHIRSVLDSCPFERFPAVVDNVVVGILNREEAKHSLMNGTQPALEAAVVCGGSESIREASQRMVTSTSGMVVIQPAPGTPVIGVLTLHDLLRAQEAATDATDAGSI
jgi:CIC family chloride channel protein